MSDKSNTLYIRLRNCLQTILELEPDIRRLEMGEGMLKEFNQLKSFLERLGQVDIVEEDVDKIEQAASSFLEELNEPMAVLGNAEFKKKLLQ